MNSKIYLAVLVAALLGVMQCAASDFILFDRSGGGMGLQKMLGLVLQSKGVEWPDGLTVSVKNIAALPEDFPGVVATESFLPVDKNKFVQLDYAVLPVIAAVPLDSPLENVTMAELKRIYSGRITDTKELNLAPGKIRIAGVAYESPVGRAFRALVMQQDLTGKGKVEPGSDILPDMFVCRTQRAAEALLATLPGAVVFGGWNLAQGCSGKYKLLKIDGVEPTAENIHSGRYKAVARHSACVSKDNSQVKNPAAIVSFLQKLALLSGEFVPPVEKNVKKND